MAWSAPRDGHRPRVKPESMDNLGAMHSAWQQRVNREKRAVKVHVKAFYPKEDHAEIMAPKVAPSLTGEQARRLHFERLYNMPGSQPLGLRAARGPARPGAGPELASFAATGGLQSRRRSASQGCLQGEAARTLATSSRAAPRRTGPLASGQKAQPITGDKLARPSRFGQQCPQINTDQLGPVFYNNAQRQTTPSLRSCRSATTGFTSDTALWREVEQAVQQEVAKVVGPLQQELQKEQDQRQKMEAALRLIAASDAAP